jgi:hypothetical protein
MQVICFSKHISHFTKIVLGSWATLKIIYAFTSDLLWQTLSTSKGRFTYSMPCPYRAHAVPLPCHAAKGLECVFPIWFTQCGRVWFTLAVPCPCPAPTMPFFSRPQHRTAAERWPVGYRPAFTFFRQPRGVPQRLLSEAYQSQTQVASVKPNNICHGRGNEW